MIHLGTKTIETDRLVLRKFTMDDAQDMFDNWAGNSHVTRFLTWPAHSDIEVSRSIIGLWEKCYGSLNYYQWCIELKKTGKAIGGISVVNIREEIGAVEVGYCIGEEFWGRGYVPEAFSALIPFYFNEMQVNRIEAKHDLNNPASGRVMAKCGLRKEGTMRQSDKNNTGICDVVYYGLVREDWKA